ncbi:MAG TPA: thioredoxin family protein [Candidatus Sulfotelmatobacter sp.]|nr:thioredoxin family protein [Candidatus Sulfotelmatobacter sp.]
MAATPSNMLALGTQLPSFTLPDAVSGRMLSSRDLAGARATLVMFICNHCPFVKHVLPEIGRLERDYAGRGLALVAINSNDVVAYPDDSPEHMKALALEQGWKFPFLFDDSQEVARAFQAACTPDFFLFDATGALAYRGRMDETRPKTEAVATGRDLRAALDAVLAGTAPAADQHPSIGCNIKWKVVAAPH